MVDKPGSVRYAGRFAIRVNGTFKQNKSVLYQNVMSNTQKSRRVLLERVNDSSAYKVGDPQ